MIELTPDRLVVRLSLLGVPIGFRCDVSRSAILDVRREPRRRISLGAHGWRGRWLVNTSTRGLVTLRLDPEQRGWVLGWPVRLRELTINPPDPQAFLAELGRG